MISSFSPLATRHPLRVTTPKAVSTFILPPSDFLPPATRYPLQGKAPQALSFFILITFSFLFSAALSAAQPKEALLIANGKYSHFAGLANPGPDAAKLSAALEQLGFRVRLLRDGNHEQMLDAIAEFERGLRNTGAIAFFHYGGHGVQVDGKNYLIPANADIPDERRVATRAVALDEVMTAMDAAAARASIIVIDACRDNPLPAGSGRNLARGLSVVGMKPKNSIVIYAAEAGSKALDGLFTPILASSLQQKGRSINQIMMSVRSEVFAKSSGQQTPGEYNQLFEELFLGELPGSKLVPSTITATPSPNPNPAILPEVEEKETLKNLKIIEDHEHARDQGNLGNSYYKGKGVSKDMVEAVKRYVPKDIVEAYALYTLLASFKDENALKSRDLIANEMTREQIAAAQKRAKELRKELGGN